MRTGKRRVKSGHFYNRFFDQAKGKNITVKKEATLRDTMKWIKIVVEKFQHQSKKIARHLEGSSVRETCFNIWEFCFNHFQYEKDEKRKEQIRTPYRSWHDRHSYKGIDCDCFSTFIATCLMQVKTKIPFVFRLTRYEEADFEHIYPVAFDENGEEIIMDAVVHSFDYEVPYTEKLDEEMELQILNGIDDLPIDAQDLFLNEDMELDGLDGKAEREARKRKRKQKREKRRETPIKERLRKGLNKINKLNPAAALLRAGILASMKLNLFKVASQLRFAYWSDVQARQNSVDLGKFNQLKRVREKLEKIFFRAGGKAENLRKAILTGRGNRNRMVALNGFGLGSIGSLPTDYDDLKTILGEDLYFDEFDGAEGLSGLGEPVTGTAAIGAASGTMGILAGLLKKIGNIFKKGTNAAKKFKAQDLVDDSEEKTRRFSIKNIANKVRNKVQERRARKNGTSLPEPENEVVTFDDDDQFNVPEEDFEIIPEDDFDFSSGGQTRQPTVINQEEPVDTADPNSADQTGKKPNAVVTWIKENQGLAWGIGGLAALGIGFIGYRALTKKKEKPKKAASSGVNGVSKKKKSSTKKKPTSRKSTTTKRKTSSTRTRTNNRTKTRTRAKKPTTRLKEISLK